MVLVIPLITTNNFLAKQSNLPSYKITIPPQSWFALESEIPEANYVLENPLNSDAVYEAKRNITEILISLTDSSPN